MSLPSTQNASLLLSGTLYVRMRTKSSRVRKKSVLHDLSKTARRQSLATSIHSLLLLLTQRLRSIDYMKLYSR